MSAELLYGTKPMSPDPQGATLAQIAMHLVHGQSPVIAEIEPGDGTYYNVLLVPAWGSNVARHLGRYGIPEEQAGEYLIVTKLGDQEGQTFYATKRVGEWDLHGIDNPWTREILVWWLKILWEWIEAERA